MAPKPQPATAPKPEPGQDQPSYECADCGWPWPRPGKPPEYAECDNCGGELVPEDET